MPARPRYTSVQTYMHVSIKQFNQELSDRIMPKALLLPNAVIWKRMLIAGTTCALSKCTNQTENVLKTIPSR